MLTPSSAARTSQKETVNLHIHYIVINCCQLLDLLRRKQTTNVLDHMGALSVFTFLTLYQIRRLRPADGYGPHYSLRSGPAIKKVHILI
jgi:hypothetical protein